MASQFKVSFVCLLVFTEYSFDVISLNADLGISIREDEYINRYKDGRTGIASANAGSSLQEDVDDSLYESKNYEEPLFLTPYIEHGNVEEAQQAALVEPFYGNIISYSGFFTVNEKYDSNMYFWFFPAERDSETAPVVMWLQGGPGSSAMYGLFEQHGPFYLSKNLKIKPRKYYWTKTMNVIYIDNPIGTGFSFTNKIKGYSSNENDVGENLYNAVTQFFQLFPQFVKNDFYLAGQSYGGKFAPVLAYVIDRNNLHSTNSDKKINLKGILIGNGFCDPVNMVNLSNYLYQIGLLDLKTKLEMGRLQGELIHSTLQEKYFKEFEMLMRMLHLVITKTGFTTFENFLFPKRQRLYGSLREFFKYPEVRNSIHVGMAAYHHSVFAKTFLILDFMKSVKPRIEVLIEKYKTLVYNGQLDLLIPYPSTVKFIRALNWSGAVEYRSAVRKLWYVDNELAGYKKTVKNFTEVLIRNAGHITPTDQPKWCFELVHRFIHNLL